MGAFIAEPIAALHWQFRIDSRYLFCVKEGQYGLLILLFSQIGRDIKDIVACAACLFDLKRCTNCSFSTSKISNVFKWHDCLNLFCLSSFKYDVGCVVFKTASLPRQRALRALWLQVPLIQHSLTRCHLIQWKSCVVFDIVPPTIASP